MFQIITRYLQCVNSIIVLISHVFKYLESLLIWYERRMPQMRSLMIDILPRIASASKVWYYLCIIFFGSVHHVVHREIQIVSKVLENYFRSSLWKPHFNEVSDLCWVRLYRTWCLLGRGPWITPVPLKDGARALTIYVWRPWWMIIYAYIIDQSKNQ